MANIIGIAVLAVLVGLAAGYLYKEKKRGARCVGCPYCSSCSGTCGEKAE